MNGALDILFLVPEIFHARFPVSVESVATHVKFFRGFAGSSVERVSASGLRPTPKHPPHAGREMKLLVPSAVIYIENAENEMTGNLIFCIGVFVLLSPFLVCVF